MLHRDIKPHNIFLSKPDNIIWNQIPTPKLADFGLATHDYSVPGAGTKGYQAPEQYAYGSENADYNEDNPITLKSDIWAVGRTILALMNLERGRDVKSYKFNSEHELPGYHDEATEAYYPRDLRDLVELCLRDQPAERPDAMKLWEWIQIHVGTVIGRKWLPMKMAYRPHDEMRWRLNCQMVNLRVKETNITHWTSPCLGSSHFWLQLQVHTGSTQHWKECLRDTDRYWKARRLSRHGSDTIRPYM